jgi:NAD(P)-dependent dehydrogenase (short-subunit alcohol dehydrogenase family)
MSAAPLEGRAVLVTGGSSGIGQAIALAAAPRRSRRRDHLSRERGRRRPGPARDPRAGTESRGHPSRSRRRRIVAKIGPASRGALGRLDVWINNAGADISPGTTPRSTASRNSIG